MTGAAPAEAAPPRHFAQRIADAPSRAELLAMATVLLAVLVGLALDELGPAWLFAAPALLALAHVLHVALHPHGSSLPIKPPLVEPQAMGAGAGAETDAEAWAQSQLLARRIVRILEVALSGHPHLDAERRDTLLNYSLDKLRVALHDRSIESVSLVQYGVDDRGGRVLTCELRIDIDVDATSLTELSSGLASGVLARAAETFRRTSQAAYHGPGSVEVTTVWRMRRPSGELLTTGRSQPMKDPGSVIPG
jgi:hypothetical protein